MNSKTKLFTAAIVFYLCFFTQAPIANDSPDVPLNTDELIDFSIATQPEAVRTGEVFKLVIDIDLEEGWHIYSVIPSKEIDAPMPTIVKVNTAQFDTDGPVFETRPIYRFEEILDLHINLHKGKSALYQNLKLKDGITPGNVTSSLEIQYQLCTDRICLPITTKSLSFSLKVEPGEPREEYLMADRSIDDIPDSGVASGLPTMLTGGFWTFIGLAALMGLVSLMTPCVFPMIPITVSFFSKQADGEQKRVIKLAILFSLGIIITYTGFGLIMSIVFGAGSALIIAANPIVNLVIALVFIVFAFSLMGVFEISLPSGIASYFDQKSRTLGGAAGVLLMGFTFTLTAFTCTVQFVGTMLIAAAQGQWIWPLIGMLVFSSVFAFPFFLLAVAPSLIKKMQKKSGEWLGRSKFVLGVLELMASVKFLSNADLVWQTNLISRNTAIIIWMVLFGFIIAYLVWLDIHAKRKKSLGQWVSLMIFGACIVLLSRGINDRSLGSLIDAVLPPPSGVHRMSEDFVSKEETESVNWLSSFQNAEQQAKEQNKQIFLEFTGYTCVNCRWMEQNVLARKAIHNKLVEDFILVRLFTDGGDNGKQNLDLQINRFQTVALPYYVILSPSGEVLRSYSGISLEVDEFLSFLSPNES